MCPHEDYCGYACRGDKTLSGCPVEDVHASLDPGATVVVLNAKTNIAEAKRVSELDEETKRKARRSVETVSSISVSAAKPA